MSEGGVYLGFTLALVIGIDNSSIQSSQDFNLTEKLTVSFSWLLHRRRCFDSTLESIAKRSRKHPAGCFGWYSIGRMDLVNSQNITLQHDLSLHQFHYI